MNAKRMIHNFIKEIDCPLSIKLVQQYLDKIEIELAEMITKLNAERAHLYT